MSSRSSILILDQKVIHGQRVYKVQKGDRVAGVGYSI